MTNPKANNKAGEYRADYNGNPFEPVQRKQSLNGTAQSANDTAQCSHDRMTQIISAIKIAAKNARTAIFILIVYLCGA
jgi:hypothetical protein